MKQLLTLFLSLLTIEGAFSQDILINSGRQMALPLSKVAQTSLSDSVKIDSKSWQSIQSILKHRSYVPDRSLYREADPINLQQRLIEESNFLGWTHELHIRAKRDSVRAHIITTIDDKRVKHNQQLRKYQRSFEKAYTQLKNIEDSIIFVSKELPSIRTQVKQRLFKLMNIHALYDTAFTAKTRVMIIDSLSQFTSQLNILDKNLNDLNLNSNTLIQNITQLKISLSQKLIDMDSLLVKANYPITPSADSVTYTLVNNKLDEILTNISNLSSLYVEYSQKAQNLDDIYRHTARQFIEFKKIGDKLLKDSAEYISSKFKESKPKQSTEEIEFGAFPGISYVVGDQRALNLNVSVLGSYSSRDSITYSNLEARLFTSSVPKNLSNPRSLFIPEISTFGTQIRYTTDRNVVVSNKARRYITNIGFMGELNLVNKRLLSDSASTSASSTTITEANSNFVVHARGGLEIVVYKGVFSVYGNYNWLSLIDNVASFKNRYSQLPKIGGRTSFGFIDIGGRLLLNPRGGDAKKYIGSGLNIVADFNLIIPRAWGRELLGNQEDNPNMDRFIPVIRLGVRKSLGTLHER